jgi:hypothetical protein
VKRQHALSRVEVSKRERELSIVDARSSRVSLSVNDTRCDRDVVRVEHLRGARDLGARPAVRDMVRALAAPAFAVIAALDSGPRADD